MSQSNPKLGAAATPSTEEQSGTVWKIIMEIEAEEFQQRLFEHCETNPDLRNDLERVFFTKGKNIVRYYPGDTEPSYASGTVLNETESDQEDDLSTSPIAIGDEQVVYRFEECLNCKKDFDLVKNKARSCEWHPGLSLLSNPFQKLTEVQGEFVVLVFYAEKTSNAGLAAIHPGRSDAKAARERGISLQTTSSRSENPSRPALRSGRQKTSSIFAARFSTSLPDQIRQQAPRRYGGVPRIRWSEGFLVWSWLGREKMMLGASKRQEAREKRPRSTRSLSCWQIRSVSKSSGNCSHSRLSLQYKSNITNI